MSTLADRIEVFASNYMDVREIATDTELQPILSDVREIERNDARYRWIKENGWELIEADRGIGPTYPEGDGLDAAIDAILSRTSETKEST